MRDSTVSDHRCVLFDVDKGIHVLGAVSAVFGRRYGSEAMERFRYHLVGEDWAGVLDSQDVNDAYDSFHGILTYYWELDFPLEKHSRNRVRNNDWVTDKVRASSTKLKDLFQMQKEFPELRDTYKRARHHHALLVRGSKRQFYQNLISNSENSTRSAWSVANRLSGKTSNRVFQKISLIDGEGSNVEDPLVISSIFNNFLRRPLTGWSVRYHLSIRSSR